MRSIVIDLASPTSVQPTLRVESGTSVPLSAYAVGALAILGLGSFAVFGVSAASKAGDFDACRATRSCDPAAVGDMRAHALVADISLVVAVVGVIGTAVVLLAWPSKKATSLAPRFGATWDASF